MRSRLQLCLILEFFLEWPQSRGLRRVSQNFHTAQGCVASVQFRRKTQTCDHMPGLPAQPETSKTFNPAAAGSII